MYHPPRIIQSHLSLPREVSKLRHPFEPIFSFVLILVGRLWLISLSFLNPYCHSFLLIQKNIKLFIIQFINIAHSQQLYNFAFRNIQFIVNFRNKMKNIQMKLIHAFGSTCSQMYKNCLTISDQQKNEPKIVFPVGKSLARKYVDRQEMDFTHFSQNTHHIQCMTILPTRKHVAVAQNQIDSNVQVIKIYSMSKEQPTHTIKIFHQTDKVGIIKKIAFSASEPKFMCAYLGQPHNKLIFIDTSRHKPLAQSNFTLSKIQKITICPYNSHLICVSGGAYIKIYKVEQYAFKPLQQIKKFPKGRVITDHAWYKKKMLLVATDKCEILILQESRQNTYQVKQQYQNMFNQINSDILKITSICSFSKGFILGSNNGKFCLWTIKQDLNSLEGDQKLQLSRKWSTTQQRAAQVTCIQISLKQDFLAISMSNNDIATLYLNDVLPQVSQMISDSAQKQIIFEYLYKGFHNQAITGMDICTQRPLIATCSQQDSTIRIWNYRNFGCKLLRMFYFKLKQLSETNKPLITLTFHPSGYYLAVGCSDKLRFFHVLNNQLRPYRQIGIKNAHIVKFSHGGNLIAVCHPFRQQSNVSCVKIFNSITLEEIAVLKDHQSEIKNLQWKINDECLSSVSQDGCLIQWRVSDWLKVRNVSRKQQNYGASIYLTQSNSILTYSRDQKYNFLEEHFPDSTSKKIKIDMKVTKMLCLPSLSYDSNSKNAILLALQNGSLVVFNGVHYPVISSHQNQHIKPAKQLLLSPCGRYVISAGQDCLILIYQLFYEEENGNIKQLEIRSAVVDDFLSDVVLINKKQIKKYQQKQKQFTKVIANLTKKLKQVSQQGTKRHKLKCAQIQMQKNRIIDDIAYRIQRINDQVQQLKGKNNNSMNQLDYKNLSQAQMLQKNYQQKISFQIEKYFQLQQEKIQLKVLHQKKIQKIKREQEQRIRQLKTQFQKKFKQSEGIYSQAKKQTQDTTNLFQQRVKQIQQQQQEQLRQIQSKRQKFKLQTAAALEQLHEKMQKLKKQHQKLSGQKQQVKLQNDQLQFNKRKTQKQVQQAIQKLKDMTVDFQQKMDSLKSKQDKIIEFQNKINDLQKKKHILSYKATQMRKAIQPKQQQIQKLKLDLIKLKKQFEASLQRKQKANLLLQKINKEKQYLEKLLKDQKHSSFQQTNLLDQIVGDIYNCVQINKNNADHKIYYKEMVKIYHKYVQKQQKIQNQNQSKGVEDVTKQIVHLQKSLFQINKSNEKNILRKHDQIFKRTKQNTQLVDNLNQIKKQNKELMLKIKSKNMQIQTLRSLKTDLIAQCPDIDSTSYKMLMNEDNPLQTMQSQKQFPKPNINSRINMDTLIPKDKIINLKENSESKKTTMQKKQCEIISQIQFVNEKVNKYEFYLKDMKQKVRKHQIFMGCSHDKMDIGYDQFQY